MYMKQKELRRVVPGFGGGDGDREERDKQAAREEMDGCTPECLRGG